VGLPSGEKGQARVSVNGRPTEPESRDAGTVWLTVKGRGSYLLEVR